MTIYDGPLTLGREALLALATWMKNQNEKIHQANTVEWRAVPPEQQYRLISVLGQMALKQIKHQSEMKEMKNEFIFPSGQQNPTEALRPLIYRLRSPINDTTNRKTFRINQATVRSG